LPLSQCVDFTVSRGTISASLTRYRFAGLLVTKSGAQPRQPDDSGGSILN
jgi:hypothetical protein